MDGDVKFVLTVVGIGLFTACGGLASCSYEANQAARAAVACAAARMEFSATDKTWKCTSIKRTSSNEEPVWP